MSGEQLDVPQEYVLNVDVLDQYTRFWSNPEDPAMDLDWLALLFMVFSLAIFFTSFAAPQ